MRDYVYLTPSVLRQQLAGQWEEPLAAAVREFAEETGLAVRPVTVRRALADLVRRRTVLRADFVAMGWPVPDEATAVGRWLLAPGLADELQRTLRVTIAGPSTLAALLNSLQMGFRTLALEKRSSEVWQVLGAVKTEFTKFGDVLATTKATLEKAARNIESAEVRSRAMAKKLKSVEALPSEAAQLMLGSDRPDSDE